MVIFLWFSNIYNKFDPFFNKNTPYINTNDIKNVIQDQKFDINEYKNKIIKTIEWKKAIPLINISFHYHILRDNNIPSIKEFIDEYERDNRDFLYLLPEDLKPGVRYRLVRSYPSLVRDFHFVNFTRELGHDTIHTLQLDLYGIDAIIPTKEKDLIFRLFYESKNSKRYLERKKNNHFIEDCIDFGLNKNNRVKIGDIFLYSDESIVEIIKAGILNKNN